VTAALWPHEAHSPIFDFDATALGAEWIDAIAAEAKRRIVLGDSIIGHSDWSGKHFRFAGEEVSVVYDWDSLRAQPEPATVGVAAITFTTNFELPGVKLTPEPDEVRAFVDEYSASRAQPLTRREREQIAAWATFVAAYTARCEHALKRPADDPDRFTAALRAHGPKYLEP
jgi:fructose-specific component phosphotransferase system IIB-like protein